MRCILRPTAHCCNSARAADHGIAEMAHRRGAVALPTTVDEIQFARRASWSVLVAAAADIEVRAGGRALSAHGVFRRAAAPVWVDDRDELRRNCADSLDDVLDILRGRATGEYGNTHIDRAIEIAQLFTPLFVSTVSPVFDVLYSAAPEFECAAHLLYHVLAMADGHDLCVRKIRFVLVPTNVVAVPSPTELIRDAISKTRRAPKRVLIQVDVAPEVVAGERRFRLKRAPDAPVEEM